ncbi:Cof-type HAD-IIB family hydrolase [Pseudomonas gingeri NCPPB 3146 = LMG 5327]|uniref:Cof-type HAD-IIB family hydrolase n=2 Tax=Pseudomonas gingeri TaxID=117681 RepID=A0A7Y7Y2A8_9PSED|nr:Cof-type HAD-IIB family hydrolase [Pseudomonas gingeri]NWC16456.1 Cof-type HAD-IIB family hydrolase [Pseudomonas gingeri]NWE46810.1 Cof-type HAD-IIB family hydrolase [Pseudomonas gingeri]NWE69461.1 Cof-type HAD-IIB family hydrolase [Pseudomonas gingeri]PNQ94356.1 Cof-type HAD-IIB family hydrolase [Pseudomonas gingeri NCPPB 3146 = LMG 5327]
MSGTARYPIRLVLSDMDGTLLRPDHSLSPRTVEAVRALRTAGVFFSLATGRPPRAMREQIDALGVDLPVAAFNGGTLMHPDGSYLVAHHVPRAAAICTLELLSRHEEVEVWVFADNHWLLRNPHGTMVPREQHALGYPPTVVEDFGPYLDRIDKIVGASANAQLLIDLEAVLQPLVADQALASRSQRAYLDITAMQANKGEALMTLAKFLGVPLEQTAAIGDGGNDPAMFHRAGLAIAMGQAEEVVKRQADVVTGSNTEDGAARAIEELILARR